jgi:hypothetical protein
MGRKRDASAEIRRAAQRLFIELANLRSPGWFQGKGVIPMAKVAKVYGAKGDNSLAGNPVQPVIRVLQSALGPGSPSKEDLLAIEKMLNAPVEIGLHDVKGRLYLDPETSLPRRVAEAAVGYLNLLAITPDAEGFVGVCPACGGVYLKHRTDQVHCTPRCRFAAWASEKGNQYFADRARENRAAKSKQKKARRKL